MPREARRAAIMRQPKKQSGIATTSSRITSPGSWRFMIWTSARPQMPTARQAIAAPTTMNSG